MVKVVLEGIIIAEAVFIVSQWRKNRRLKKEIEETEIIVMQKELERQNYLITIEPKRQEIKALRLRINALQAHKRYIESAGMHRLSQPAMPALVPTPAEDETIIEPEVDAK